VEPSLAKFIVPEWSNGAISKPVVSRLLKIGATCDGSYQGDGGELDRRNQRSQHSDRL